MSFDFETAPPQFRTICAQACLFLMSSEKKLKEKITNLEEERKVFLGLLEGKKSIEKENVELKIEIKLLRQEQVNKTGSDDQIKLKELERKNRGMKKKLHRFLHTVQKKCTCPFRDTITKNITPLHNSSSHKGTTISNVFFKSPVKPKNNQSINALLAPMTEDFSVETPKGALKASTPVIVGETEKSPFDYYDVDSDEIASDDDWPNSPSLFTSHNNNDGNISTPFDIQKMIGIGKKPLSMAIGVDMSIEHQTAKYNEISAELFGDESPKGALKSMNILTVKKNTESISCITNTNNISEKDSVNEKSKSNYKDNIPIVPHGNKENSPAVSSDLVTTTVKSEVDTSQKKSCKEDIPVKSSSGFVSTVVVKKEVEEEKPITKTKKSKGMKEAILFDDDSFFEISQFIEQKSKVAKIVPEMKNTTNPSSSSVTPSTSEKKKSPVNEEQKSLKDKNVAEGLKKKSVVKYKYSAVVRKKDEREKLNGYACEECRRYYQSDNLTEERLREVLKQCSRHRHESSPPPSTPEGFWNLDFPPTQDCIDKGYMLDADQTLPDYAKPKLRKQKRRKDVKFE